MREEEIDKILKSTINNDIKAPESLKNRISNEIKNMDNMNNNNDKTKNKGKKSILKVMQSIAAVAVISILGVTTYATVTKNPILEKLGLIKGSTTYEEVVKEINEDLSNDYAQITLKRMASDNAYIIMEYNVNLKEMAIEKFGDIEKDVFSGYDIDIINSIRINNEEIDIAFNRTGYVNRISETEYSIFQIIQIANIESKDLKIEISEKYLIANEQQSVINKSVIIEATKKENTKAFKKIEKKVENKTITIESFQNTTFETFIKISVDITNITKNDLDSFYSEKNPNNISFTILDNNNNYIPHFCYMKKSFIEDDKGNKLDILSSYDENNNISYENAKSHLEYIITLGDIDKEISKLKIVPYISILPDERGDDYEDYYNNLEWHKLESGEYIQKNTLGGELELTKMEVDSEKIRFAYNLKGFITGREDMVLLRIKDEKLGFNVIYPTNTYIKKMNNDENVSEFYRNIENVGIYSYNFEDEDDYKLKDISKIEFALLVEPTIKLLDSEIKLIVPEQYENCLTINKVELKNIKKDEKLEIYTQNIINEVNDLGEIENTTNISFYDNNEYSKDIILDDDIENVYLKDGIEFKYQSTFEQTEDTFNTSGFEAIEDDYGNRLQIRKENISNLITLKNIVEREQKLEMYDGSNYRTIVKQEEYISLPSGIEGYKFECTTIDNAYQIIFITQKENKAYSFTFSITNKLRYEDYSEIMNEILNTLKINI